MKVLVVAAHPDDEILGVGGSIFKHKARGDSVYVCIVTKACVPQWPETYIAEKLLEQKKVDKLLGITKRFNLDFPTAKLNTIASGEINRSITSVINGVNPDVVYTHFESDLNYDHTVVFNGCMVGSRPPRNNKLLCFETLSESEWNNKPFLPNLWVDVSKFIDRKVKAFQIYKSEVKSYPHPRSPQGIRALALKRGTEICAEYAEAFILIREIWC